MSMIKILLEMAQSNILFMDSLPPTDPSLKEKVSEETIQTLETVIKMLRQDKPTKPMVSKIGTLGDDALSYNIFPIDERDDVDWRFYCAQEVQMWTAKELDFSDDRKEYMTLSSREKNLYKDLLGFFQPADALVTQSSLRFILETERYIEQTFLIFQLAIEAVHAESYGLGVAAIIPDKKEQEEVYQMINTLDCVKAKAQFIKDLIDSDAPRNERLFAAAYTEGVFFVTLFAIIFYLRSRGKMKTFIFMNKQVSADETLHRNFFIEKVKQVGLPPRERMEDIARKAVAIEIDHLAYILREPINTKEEDELAGITLENLSSYARSLSDQIFAGVGAPILFGDKVDLPWMNDLSTVKRPNFYEVQVNGYKRKALTDAVDWKSRAGSTTEKVITTSSAVCNPDDVDF